MSVDYIMAIDPGQATGIAIGRYTEKDPMEVIYTGIIPFGVRGFIDWLEETKEGRGITEMDCMRNYPRSYREIDFHVDVVCERFHLRNNKFTPDLEPLRIEGVLIDRFGKVVTWHDPADKGLVGDEFLKEHDLWVTGSQVGHKDGRDANDALLHLFARAMRTRHYPTLDAYWR